jgi:hypothetical protein
MERRFLRLVTTPAPAAQRTIDVMTWPRLSRGVVGRLDQFSGLIADTGKGVETMAARLAQLEAGLKRSLHEAMPEVSPARDRAVQAARALISKLEEFIAQQERQPS